MLCHPFGPGNSIGTGGADRTGAWHVMIFPSNRVRIVVATKQVHFCKWHDGLSVLVKNETRKEPFRGTVFVFQAKRAERLKLHYWEGSGLGWRTSDWRKRLSLGLRSRMG